MGNGGIRGFVGMVALLGALAGASCQRTRGDAGGLGGSSPMIGDTGGAKGAGGMGTPNGGEAGGGGAAGGGGEAAVPMTDGGLTTDLSTGDVRSGDLDAQACTEMATRNVTVADLPPDVLLLFDRSGSMQEDLSGVMCSGGCGANSKWSIATATVANFLSMTEGMVNWGLKLFATGTSNSSCTVSSTAEVAPAPLNAEAINMVLATTVAGSSTPTTAALRNAGAYLKSFTDLNRKFILLVTDGVPTCGTSFCAPGTAGSVSANSCDDANAIAMVTTLHDMDVPVFVLGIGTSNSPGDATLSAMAVNGGYPRNDSPAYYPIDSAQNLVETLGTVTALVSTCYFSVTPTPKVAAQIGSVVGDGTLILPDPVNGWTFATMTNSAGIVLNGASCDSYRSGAIKSVQVELLCGNDPSTKN